MTIVMSIIDAAPTTEWAYAPLLAALGTLVVVLAIWATTAPGR